MEYLNVVGNQNGRKERYMGKEEVKSRNHIGDMEKII